MTSAQKSEWDSGFEARLREYLYGPSPDVAVDVDALTRWERKGYDAACEAQVECDGGYIQYKHGGRVR